MTRSLVTWYAFTFDSQQLLDISESFQIEHIYAKKRQDMESGLSSDHILESLGNKIMLEENINISASDYRFEDKIKIYSGGMRRGGSKEKSKIAEIDEITKMSSFGEAEISARNDIIIDRFFDYLREENLIK